MKNAPPELTDGTYSWYAQGEKSRVDLWLDSTGFTISTAGRSILNSQQVPRHLEAIPSGAHLIRRSPDLDFVTIPVKYRSVSMGVAPQLNSNLNGALYFGYRLDSFRAAEQKRTEGGLDHFGISGGVFAGLGNTFVSPTTTAGRQSLEYDGVVFIRGAAVIIAVKRFTVGLAAGRDRLTDGNDRNWIYRNKPWLGVAVGLNIN